MCLHLTKQGTEYHSKLLFNDQETVIVYKVLNHQKDGLKSPYYKSAKWIPGAVKESSRKNISISRYEERRDEVNKGLHFFTSLRGARAEAANRRSISYRPATVEVWAAEVKAEDIVAIGRFGMHGYNNKANSLVAHRAKLLHRVVKK
jgi:hypothetical protein